MVTTQATEEALTPISKRLHLIDTLRAFALLGVIVMNYVGMVAALVSNEIFPVASSLDLSIAAFDLVLIQGKARACFALLFGVGFGLLMMRVAAREVHFTAWYLRRMSALLIIGILHLAFLFWGDILILYALIGMVLLLFRGWSNQAILKLGLALVVLPPLLFGATEALTGAPLPNLAGLSPEAAEGVMASTAPVYRSGTYLDFVQANLSYYRDHYLTDTSYVVIYNLSVLGLFLLGLWTARNGVLADVEKWRPFLRKTAWICLPLGLLLSIIHASRRMGIETEGAAYGLVTAAYSGLSIMAFGYIAALALFLSRRGAGIQRFLSPMGRMALTGYIVANAIGVFIWYGWGLGQMGAWNIAAINLLALCVFLVLCAFSFLWLSVARFGPLEWIWRSVTYRKVQPMLIRSDGTGAPRAA